MSTQLQPRPTITDVARACGFSEATVSYVINGKRVLKPDTRERVFRAMRELNYHPSAVARGLSSKKVHTFGVLLGAVDSIETVTNPYSSGLLNGIMIAAQREGFNVTFFTAPWISAEESSPALRDGRTDGILAIAPPVTSDIVAGLVSLQMPLVVIAGDPAHDVTSVDVDDYQGTTLAVEHLLQLGHRDIAFLTGNEDLASFAPRKAAFLAAHAKAGVQPRLDLIQVSHFDGSLAYRQTRELLTGDRPPSAVCAGNDAIGASVIEAARDAGVAVPRQLSVVGFDDSPAAMMVSPNLTTVRQPLREIGETAAGLLIQYMRQPDDFEKSTRLLPAELIVRGTTAPPA